MASAVLVLLLAAAAPLIAMGTEIWPGLPPCALCLWQRWPYWAAAGLAGVAVFAAGRGRAVLIGLAGVAALASGAIAVLHLGVEWGWWPSPLPGCAAPTLRPGASIEDLLRAMPATPAKPCDAPTFLIPGLPVSMAGMNLIYALGLGALAFALARREREA
ncbi:MAG TPA: disulfide bond formation protein B [Acetobacteraceae bacterium]|nr:disulfide bond formation protein B [Acetobacteraceae bacterium]